MNRIIETKKIIPLLIIIFGIMNVAFAVSLSPEIKEKLFDEGKLQDYYEQLIEYKVGGLSGPVISRCPKTGLESDEATDTISILVLLVDFSDNPESAGDVDWAEAYHFDSVLFSTGGINPTGSMTEFYTENSYGKVLIRGEVHGWYRMPQTYAYYVDGSTGTGGLFPRNSRGLAIDAVNAADADGISYSQFDTFDPNGVGSDGEVDGLMIIHAGPGYENTGEVDQMGSHMTTLGGNSLYLDSTIIDAFTVQPEEYALTRDLSPIGVFCHEFGHVLGLPDLYEIDYVPSSADGIGIWSLMASGSYKGDAQRPSHFDPWCKEWLGFLNPITITGNLTDVDIPQIESEPIVYKLINNSAIPNEYFLVENRQPVGFDLGLPSGGLMIYHVNLSSWGNDLPTPYNVAVEQADGSFNLENTPNNNGDPGDPWPGVSNNRSFDDLSTPSSRGYSGASSQISVWNVSDSDSLMTANLDIAWSRPYFDLNNYAFNDNNGNGDIEAGETVEFVFSMYNYWLTASNVTVSLSSNNPGILFAVDTITYSIFTGDGATIYNGSEPFIFTMPDTLIPTYDSFFVTISSDDGSFTNAFGIEQVVGAPQILLIDDDRGGDYEDVYNATLYNRLIPADQWNTQTSGSPNSTLLDKYNMVIWFTGDTATEKLSTDDITAMTNYMDNGGNLFLTGQMIAFELENDNPTFMANYLKCNRGDNTFGFAHIGVDGSAIGDGIQVRYDSYNNQEFTRMEYIVPVNGGNAEFMYTTDLFTAVSYEGSYNLVFFDFGFEAISNNFTYQDYTTRDTVLARILTFFGEQLTEVRQINNSILPKTFSLEQNYPNPFNPVTKIRYSIRNENQQLSRTVLRVFNLLGREVKILVDEYQRTGTYEVSWDGTDNGGHQTASGIYFYKLSRDDFSETKKMILLK